MYGNQGNYGRNGAADYGQMYNQSSYQPESQASEDRFLGRLLSASGVPNDAGRIRWPVGLRSLAGTRSDELCEQIDALFVLAAAEAVVGPVNPNVAKRLARDVEEFRQRLLKDKNERFRMPLRVYEEAEDFLAKLSSAEKVLRAGLGNAVEINSADASPGSAQGQRAEVTLEDKRFLPSRLAIAAGTTVVWTNRGRHRHTVTSEQGFWNSGPMTAGATYTQQFDKPGTYAYHCEIHPQEMRATIEVK
jgi:plastocyanin